MEPILSRLQAAQNLDGGWGYAPGRESRIEPTAWMTLALSGQPGVERALAWLERSLDEHSQAISTPTTEASQWGTSLVALAFLHHHHPASTRVLDVVLQQHARVVSPPLPTNPTGDLPVWGWMNSAFSWIEPTAYAVWALQRARASELVLDRGHIDQRLGFAKKVLLGRRCADGGWNYGSNFGTEYQLTAFPVPTVLGLLTLCALDEKEDALKTWPMAVRLINEEPSALAFAWLVLAGKVLGQSVTDFEPRLLAGWDRLTSQQHLTGAIALLAMGDGWKDWS